MLFVQLLAKRCPAVHLVFLSFEKTFEKRRVRVQKWPLTPRDRTLTAMSTSTMFFLPISPGQKVSFTKGRGATSK